MKILIIEDDPNKFNNISDYLKKIDMKIELDRKVSYNSGLKEILKKKNEVILLDMSIPTYDISNTEDGGTMRTFGGIDILNQIKRYSINIPVIIITQFENFGNDLEKINLLELKNNLDNLNNDCYKKLIYYSASNNKWEKELFEILNKIGG